MAVNINRAFKLYGWCSRICGIESGGGIERLSVHTFLTDDGSVDTKGPMEIAINDRRAAELAQLGFMPILHRKNSEMAAFIGAGSLHKPARLAEDDAMANAYLAAQLPYLFAVCRFAHYLKSITRDKIDEFREPVDLEMWLNKWINNYVEPNLEMATEVARARRPLQAAEVVVENHPYRAGMYSCKLYLLPHYQLGALKASLRVGISLPPTVRG
jgi:type VI secretion system protein ImpC